MSITNPGTFYIQRNIWNPLSTSCESGIRICRISRGKFSFVSSTFASLRRYPINEIRPATKFSFHTLMFDPSSRVIKVANQCLRWTTREVAGSGGFALIIWYFRMGRKLINVCFTFQLKAFYVDLLVPLETNLEKDTKVVQVSELNY